jgi:hypothetical protein
MFANEYTSHDMVSSGVASFATSSNSGAIHLVEPPTLEVKKDGPWSSAMTLESPKSLRCAVSSSIRILAYDSRRIERGRHGEEAHANNGRTYRRQIPMDNLLRMN